MRRRPRHIKLDAGGTITIEHQRGGRSRYSPQTRVWGLAIAVALAGAGCGPPKISDKNLVLIDVAETVELVEGRRTLLGLGSTETAFLVDPRSERDYAKGHIPGAVNLPFQDVSTRYVELKGREILIVYGNDYNEAVPEAMSKRLLELGFADVRTLKGGMRAWTEAGYEIETGAGAP